MLVLIETLNALSMNYCYETLDTIVDDGQYMEVSIAYK